MFTNIYKGKRVFITGHTGFKGSWLTAWLMHLGAELAGFADRVPTSPSNFEAMGLAERIHDLRGDVRDRKALCSAMRDFAPDMVFHLAAQALVRASYQEPALTFETNAMGTLNILEAVRATPSVKAVVCITSDKCYRNDEWVWGYREQDHLGGEDPYSASKGCAEIVAHSYFKTFFKDGPACATTRAGNVIGGGDWALDRIVPDCARAWSVGDAAQIRSPHATRPWQHVLEPLSGYLWLGARLVGEAQGVFSLTGEAYNFGPAADVNNTVADVVDALSLHWPGFRSEMDRGGAPGMKECTLLKLCCDKALACLGWKAALNFEECIRYTAEWYRAYYAPDRPDMLAFTLGQIAAYTVAAEARGLPWIR
ncbi:MAG: CDP-glucose 4,6-dehydratase [Desulfovibrionaceae bacterium]|nr:CDP-glucose 4,6-dehydratase [Desulfovibrionaceae bacterium]